VKRISLLALLVNSSGKMDKVRSVCGDGIWNRPLQFFPLAQSEIICAIINVGVFFILSVEVFCVVD
jgi:hypothetical protein